MILFLAATAAAVYAFYEQKTATDNALRAQSEKKMAQEQEQTAQIQRKQALANQDMAIGFASTTVRGFSDLSDFVVGQHDVQGKFESVLKEAAKVHDSVLQREPNNFPASIMRINALSALSRIHFVTGHTQAAEEECEKLEVEATKLAETSTDDMHRILAAYMLASASRTRRELQQTDRARADLKTAAQIADTVHSGKLINGNAGDQQVLRCLSIVYSAAGNFHGENDDLKAAISYYRKAIHVLAQYEDEALPATRKGDLDDASREYLVLDIQALGSRQAKAHLKHEAVDTYSRGVRLATSWSQKSPGDADLMDALFWSYVGRGDVELDENQYISARQDFDRAKAVSGKELSQKTADGQYDAAVAEERLGNIEHYMAESEKDPEIQKKELQTAQKLHDKALEMFQQMKGGSGKDPAVEHYIGSEESNLGWDFSGLGQSPEAKEQYKKSIPSLQLTADVLQTDEALSAVARAYRTLAELELDSNDYKEASQNFEEAIVAEKKLVAPDSNARHLILQDTKHLADSEFQNQKVDDSLKRYGGSIEDAEKWTQSTAASSDLFKDIIWLYLGRGDIELSQNAYPEAEKDFGSARDNLKHLDLASVDGKYIKSCVLERFGLLWKQRADAETDRARMNDDLLRAKTFQDDAANERHQIEGAGTSAEIEKSIGITEQNLGMATYELKDYDAAHKYLAASAKAYQQVVLMHSTEQAKVDLEKAYRMLAAVDVDQGGEQLSQGNYSEASKDFESARSTAKQAEAAGVDGRFVRRHTEEYIANYWREKGRSEKDTAQREKDSRQALEADESFLKLSEQIAQTNKSADATQNVGKGEERVGLDYSYLGDTENARKSFRASLKTFEQLPPGDEATRAIAAAYGNLAQMELNLNNTLAAREAFGSEIELLMPLTENPHADPADKRSLAAALGVRSWENALLGDFWTALSDAEKGSFLDSKQMFIEVNKGDAYLLLGQPEAARKIYLAVVDRQPELRADILSDLNEMGSHPELKADPKVLASIRSELTNHKPSNPQGVASKQ